MEVMLLFFWIVGAFVIGFMGNARRIGFFGAFILAILLSPLIGLIFVLVSQTNKEYYGNIIRQKKQTEAIMRLQAQQVSQVNQISIPDELAKLKGMLDQNLISAEEYEKAKVRLIG
jgi:hypothetical protein